MSYSEDYKNYAQVLRSRGLTVSQIQKKLGIGSTWIKKYTEANQTPPYTIADIIDLILDLSFKTALDANIDKGQNPSQFAWPLSQYASIIEKLARTNDIVDDLQEVLILENLLIELDKNPPEDPIKRIQEMYDEKRKAL